MVVVAVVVTAVVLASAVAHAHTTTSAASTTPASPSKRLPKIPLCLGLAVRCALIPSALHCGIRQSGLSCQHLLNHVPGRLLSCCK